MRSEIVSRHGTMKLCVKALSVTFLALLHSFVLSVNTTSVYHNFLTTPILVLRDTDFNDITISSDFSQLQEPMAQIFNN